MAQINDKMTSETDGWDITIGKGVNSGIGTENDEHEHEQCANDCCNKSSLQNHRNMSPGPSILKRRTRKGIEPSIHLCEKITELTLRSEGSFDTDPTVTTADLSNSLRTLNITSEDNTGTTLKTVSFDTVSIHEHTMVLGNHPDCSIGPPVQLGWERQTSQVQNLDEYELNRRPRRRLHNLALSYYQRKNILLQTNPGEHNTQLTKKDLKKAERKVQQDNRKRTVSRYISTFSVAEAAVQTVGRKLTKASKKSGGRRTL